MLVKALFSVARHIQPTIIFIEGHEACLRQDAGRGDEDEVDHAAADQAGVAADKQGDSTCGRDDGGVHV